MSRYQIVPLSGLRQFNAENLLRAQQEAAYATLQGWAEVGLLEERRAQLAHDGSPVCPYTMRAVAVTLRDFPRLNAQLSSEGLCVYEQVSLGVMVVREDGVLVPVIEKAAQKAPGQLADEAARVAHEACCGHMHRHKTRRPTFTLVDLSHYAVDAFTPLLPSHSAGILGLGRVEPHYRPDERGQPCAVVRQSVCLTFDHRATDGLYAARFLSAVVRRLEQPQGLGLAEEGQQREYAVPESRHENA